MDGDSKSRLEQILEGTYTGKPLSRLESLLSGGAGCDCDPNDMIQVNARINALSNQVKAMGDNMDTMNEKVEKCAVKTEVSNSLESLDTNLKQYVTDNAITGIN